MLYEKIESALVSTFEDFKLSKSEKVGLKAVLADYQDDIEALNFARNCAFDLIASNIRESTKYCQESIKWLEHVIRILDSARSSKSLTQLDAYFSPGSQCANRIISLAKQAKETIDVCVFTISDDTITSALLAAHKSGINVRIITDNDKSEDMGSDVSALASAGIDLKMDNSANHMHHKFALFDSQYLVNGSFNWTRSASRYNHENITVISDSGLIKSFSNMFDSLWAEFK